MSKPARKLSFREQVRQSMAELQAIIDRGESPSGNSRLTVRTIEVAEPSVHTAKSVQAIRRSLNVSQAVFAQVLGVSPALVRAWELGTRVPAPIARRLLDQVRQDPSAFASLVRGHKADKRFRTTSRKRRVA